jgi:hypothetical protein
MRKGRVLALVGFAACAAIVVSVTVAGAAIVNTNEYAVPLPGTEYQTKILISAGDTVPETSQPGKQYQVVGIPDGLGAYKERGKRVVFMNHELTSGTLSSPVLAPGEPQNRGALVSKLIVDREGNVLSGERAYDWVFNENTFVGPAADTSAGNTTRPFSRFCSGELAGPKEHGFDRWIYITNEEEGTPAASFDGLGGLAVAIVDNNLHTLPRLGRFAWENTVTQPKRGSRTVIMSLEDGPSDLELDKENSQVYMYVGTKMRDPGQTVLGRNGLDNGNLFVLAPATAAQSSEATFATGSIPVQWVNLGNVSALNEAQLEAASDAVNAIRFARPEDGAWNDRNENEFFFVTTGSNGAATGALGNPNNLGRLYSLKLDKKDPTRGGTLSVVVNADRVIASGGDTAISPDNIDVSNRYLMINEDGTGAPAGSRQVMADKGRDGSIWRFELTSGPVGVSSQGERVVELDPPGWDGVAVDPGIWETSGIIDTGSLWGGGSWLFDVQAHAPTAAPGTGTVEDGQLLLLTKNK